jgi:hypothetical protein
MESLPQEYTLDEILSFNSELKNWTQKNPKSIYGILTRLKTARVSRDILKKTKIGLQVKKIQKAKFEDFNSSQKKIIRTAREVFAKWKK